MIFLERESFISRHILILTCHTVQHPRNHARRDVFVQESDDPYPQRCHQINDTHDKTGRSGIL